MGLKDRADTAPAKKKAATKKSKYASVTVKTFKVSDLEEAPYNPRSITSEALKGLAASIDQFGLAALPVVNVAGGKPRLVGGHQRKKVLEARGDETVRCIVVRFDEETEQRANLALNNPHIEGEFIPEMTRDLLSQLQESFSEDKRFQSLRFDTLYKQLTRTMTHIEGVDDQVLSGKTGDDDCPSLGKAKPLSKLGKFYQLGDHVILCGRLNAPGSLEGFPVDSADAAFCQFIGNNLVSDSALDTYLKHALVNTVGAMHIACEDSTHVNIQRRFIALGGHYSCTIVCYPPDPKVAVSKPYRCVTVPILYGWPKGTSRPWFGNANQGNVWPMQPPFVGGDLPVEAVVRAIQNVTKAGDTVLDVNVRRGTSIIAAEKTGRRLIGYCAHAREMDAVRARWTHFVKGQDVDWRAATKEL